MIVADTVLLWRSDMVTVASKVSREMLKRLSGLRCYTRETLLRRKMGGTVVEVKAAIYSIQQSIATSLNEDSP